VWKPRQVAGVAGRCVFAIILVDGLMAGGKHACPILLAYLLAVYVVAASPVGRDAHIEPSGGSDAPTASGMAGPDLLGGTKHGNPAGAALCRAPRTRPFRSSGIKGVRPGIVGPIATARAVRCLRTTSLYVLIWPWFMWLPPRRELIQLVAQKVRRRARHLLPGYILSSPGFNPPRGSIASFSR